MTDGMLLPNAVLLASYVLIAWERIPKVVIALLGGMIVILAGVLTQAEAIASIDFNVIFLLVGMMILVNILKSTGAIRALGLFAVRMVHGSGVKLMIALSFITALSSALLDNVTTVILLGSVTVALAQQLGFNPVPFLITQAIASNVGGTATLIGDPPNIMIGSAAGLSFNDFIINLAPAVFLMFPFTVLTLYLMYKPQLQLPEHVRERMNHLHPEEAITDRKLMVQALIVIGLVMLGFVLHEALHKEAGTIALTGAALLMIFENKKDIWDDVEWTSVFFFIGLFIIVGAVEKVGTIHMLSEMLFEATEGNYNLIAVSLVWVSGFLSAFIDNIPYTATMIPLVNNLSAYYEDIRPLWWSLALGACLGGNGTMIGAMANVVIADLAHREGHPIRFLEFMKVGMIIMIQTLAIATAYVWFRYLA